MAKTKPDDNAAPGKPSPASKQANGILKERRRVVEEYVTSLREVLRRLLNKLH